MNLQAIVGPITAAVSPAVPMTVKVSQSYVTNADGSRAPSYAAPVTVQGYAQPLSYNDIVQADGLSIQGVRQKVYLQGAVSGLVRASNKGGDLITFPDGTIWLVALVSEDWPDWTSCIVTLQDNA